MLGDAGRLKVNAGRLKVNAGRLWGMLGGSR